MVLDTEKCALIASALDDCKIAACRDEDKNPIRGAKANPEFEIPKGAICRIKCRQVKSQRCKCCEQGFAVSVAYCCLYCCLHCCLDWKGMS